MACRQEICCQIPIHADGLCFTGLVQVGQVGTLADAMQQYHQQLLFDKSHLTLTPRPINFNHSHRSRRHWIRGLQVSAMPRSKQRRTSTPSEVVAEEVLAVAEDVGDRMVQGCPTFDVVHENWSGPKTNMK